MKVLIVHDIGSEFGGAETMVLELRNSLIDMGHDVKVLSGNEYPQKKRINDFEFKSFRSDSWLRFFLYIYNPFARTAIKKVLKEFHPDVVHLHNVSKASASILFSLKNYPTIMTTHDFECIDQTTFSQIKSLHPFKESYRAYFQFNRNASYYIQKLRYFIIHKGQKNIDLFIVPSQAMATILRESMITSPIAVVYNGKGQLKRRTIRYSKRPSRILFVGRLVTEKGTHILIEAMGKVSELFPTAKLTIVGEGPEARALKDLVGKNRLNNYVHFAGSVSQKEIERYYEETDIMVVPSIWYEPFGMVAVEAMLHGKPVIASRAGGLAELVDDGKNGLLVRPGSSIELASSISKLLANPKKIEAMGRASLKKVEAFSAANFINQTVAIYRDIIAQYQQ